MMTISLVVNAVVLVPVCAGLLRNRSWAQECYGPETASRGILLSVYTAILICSIVLLVRRNPSEVAVLLAVQVLYKVITPFAVGSLGNPVVISNLVIAGLHTLTLWVTFRAGGPEPLS